MFNIEKKNLYLFKNILNLSKIIFIKSEFHLTHITSYLNGITIENIWSYEKEFSHCKTIASYKRKLLWKIFFQRHWKIITLSLSINKKGLAIKYRRFSLMALHKFKLAKEIRAQFLWRLFCPKKFFLTSVFYLKV